MEPPHGFVVGPLLSCSAASAIWFESPGETAALRLLPGEQLLLTGVRWRTGTGGKEVVSH